MNREHRDIAVLLIGQAAAFAYPIIATPLLIRRLGIESYGVAMYAFSCVLLAGLVVDFGFNLSSLDALGKADSVTGRQAVIRETLGTKLVLWLPVSLLTLALGLTRALPHLGHLPLLFPALLLGNVFFPPWLLQGLGQAKALTAITVASRLACLGLVVLLVHSPSDTAAALVLQQAPMLVSVPFAWLVARRAGARFELRLRQPHLSILRSSTPMFVSALASGALNYANSVVLGVFGDKATLGRYNAGTRVSGSALTALTPVQSVTLPAMSRASHDARLFHHQARRALVPYLVLYPLAGLTLGGLAPQIADRYLHDTHSTTISVLHLLAIGVAATGIEVWAYSALIACGMSRNATYTYLGVAALHVICAFVIGWHSASAVSLAALWAVSSCLIAAALGLQAGRAMKVESHP